MCASGAGEFADGFEAAPGGVEVHVVVEDGEGGGGHVLALDPCYRFLWLAPVLSAFFEFNWTDFELVELVIKENEN